LYEHGGCDNRSKSQSCSTGDGGGMAETGGCRQTFETRANANAVKASGVTLYRIEVIRSLDGDIAELFYVQTDELIARGTPEEVENELARILREAAQEGTDGQ
jgi:hypothetical protein